MSSFEELGIGAGVFLRETGRIPPELARMPGFGRVTGEANRELEADVWKAKMERGAVSYPFRGHGERVPNDEGDEIQLQNELARRGEVLRDQLRRVMVMALPLEMLLDILAGKTRIDYERSELPADATPVGAQWNMETNCLEIRIHHPSFLQTTPGCCFPRVLITVANVEPQQPTEGLTEPALTLEEMGTLASEQKWEAKGGD